MNNNEYNYRVNIRVKDYKGADTLVHQDVVAKDARQARKLANLGEHETFVSARRIKPVEKVEEKAWGTPSAEPHQTAIPPSKVPEAEVPSDRNLLLELQEEAETRIRNWKARSTVLLTLYADSLLPTNKKPKRRCITCNGKKYTSLIFVVKEQTKKTPVVELVKAFNTHRMGIYLRDTKKGNLKVIIVDAAV